MNKIINKSPASLLVFDKRFLLLLVSIILLSSYFWLSSRYPALDAKALMAASIEMDDGLSFNAWLQHSHKESWLFEIFITYLNWINTNKQGMLFGMTFAVLFMSLIPLLREKITTKPGTFSATSLGVLLGTPLGVCTNCAAPIGYGLYVKGARLESAIATMISSPNFNIVIVTMLFSLFPLYLVIIKLSAVILTLFVIVPLIVKWTPAETYSPNNLGNTTAVKLDNHSSNDWLTSIKYVLSQVGSNALYLCLKVLPIMLLAGFIGSILIVAFPWESLIDLFITKSTLLTIVFMMALSLFGLLLPVPIAFDIIICATLLSAGMPVKFVAILLFVLGSFSIYSLMVLWKGGAKKACLLLALGLVIIGFSTGIVSHYAERYYNKNYLNTAYSHLLSPDAVKHKVPPIIVDKQSTVLDSSPPIQWKATHSNKINYFDLFDRQAKNSAWHFEQIKIKNPITHNKEKIFQHITPYSNLNGLSAGDINNNNWVDFIAITHHGLYQYKNLGGEFQLVELFPQFTQPVSSAALIDLNNDGWLDLYFSSVNQGEYISYNNGQGILLTPQLIKSETDELVYTMALAFGDIDYDGDIDIILGRQDGLSPRHISNSKSQDLLLINHNKHFEIQPLISKPGKTLSILLSDINADGYADLMVGNDYSDPDEYFWGSVDINTMQPWSTSTLPLITKTTMSIDSADINNDLKLDTYHAQIARPRPSPPFGIDVIGINEFVEGECSQANSSAESKNLDSSHCRDLAFKEATLSRKVSECFELDNNLISDCIAIYIYNNGSNKYQSKYSQYFSKLYPLIHKQYVMASNHKQYASDAHIKNNRESGQFMQLKDGNLLFLQTASSKDAITFSRQEEKYGVNIGGWSWNAKFSDYDGDGWQDLFIVNGYSTAPQFFENILYKNNEGKHFTNASQALGLNDFSNTLSSLKLDIDNDGDLDIITFDIDGYIKTYINHETVNHHIQFQLRDSIGNHQGIGSFITIHYGNNKAQIREIKASGGYQSHDDKIVHFGLAQHKKIDNIEVRWSTGETVKYSGPFYSGKRYQITR
tara:strand:+ start:993 stop:4127 length:3135 start_codon:yes stop_codon:yes gene_type:complete